MKDLFCFPEVLIIIFAWIFIHTKINISLFQRFQPWLKNSIPVFNNIVCRLISAFIFQLHDNN